MKQGSNNILFRYRILWHILFWVGFYLFYSISYGEYTDSYAWEFKSNLIMLPVRMLATYTLIYYLIPRFLMKRKYSQFIVLTILHAFLFGFAIWQMYYTVPFYGDMSKYPFFYWPKILVAILTNYQIPAFAATIKFFKEWYRDQSRKQSLVHEKQEAELNFLKTQIHPHFLFNTLNNLYALTLKKSDDAPEVVLKLSDLLRYMLYDCSSDFVPLHKELTFIDNYIELQRIRHDQKTMHITYTKLGEVDGHEVAPLLLLPIVENCFKHGVGPGKEVMNIDIELQVLADALKMKVTNTLVNGKKEFEEGLGLTNVRRRLNLLYPDKHAFVISTHDGKFEVTLTINW